MALLSLVVSGLGIATWVTAQASRLVIDGELARALHDRRMRRVMDQMQGHYIVVGYGRLGRAVARELLAAGHSVCAIDREVDPLDHPGVLLVRGDGSNDDVLCRAAIERARGVAVTAAPTAEAIYITLSAR